MEGCSAAIITAISFLSTDGDSSAETNDCQLGCELSFIRNHAITIFVRQLHASFEWLDSIVSSVPEDSPSAMPRLNHFAVRVDMLSKIVLRERSSEGLETIEIVIHTIHSTYYIAKRLQWMPNKEPHLTQLK